MIGHFINMVVPMISEMREGYDIKIKELLQRWEDSRKLPRKRKKLERKDILLTINILEYGQDLMDPLRMFNI